MDASIAQASSGAPVAHRRALSTAGLVVAFGLVYSGVHLLPVGDQLRSALESILYLVPVLIALVAATVAARRTTGHLRREWTLTLIAVLILTAVEFNWSIYAAFIDPVGPPDGSFLLEMELVAYLLFIPVALWSVRGEGVTTLRKWSDGLDLGLLLLVNTFLTMVLVVKTTHGTLYLHDLSELTEFLSIVLDLALAFFLLGYRRPTKIEPRTLLGAVFGLWAIGDALYFGTLGVGTYVSGGTTAYAIDLFWMAGWGVLAATAWLRISRPAVESLSDEAQYTVPWAPLVTALLTLVVGIPYLLAIVLSGSVDRWDYILAGSVWLALASLVAARGVLMLAENTRLTVALAEAADVAHERASTSEARFQTVFAQAPLGIAIIEPASGMFREVNPAFCRILHRSRDELLTLSFRDITHPDDIAVSNRNNQQLTQGKIDSYTVEKRYLRSGGESVWVSLRVVSLVEGNGSPELHIGIMEDITDRRRAAGDLMESQMATIFALAKLAESRDDETGRHIECVQGLCRALAESLHTDIAFADRIDDEFVNMLFNAAPLHDVGKVGVPDAILLKPGKLTPEEFEVIKSHTLIGAETLAAVQGRHPTNAFIRMGADIARSHHERWDGTGYPDGLAGEQIPLTARIMAVADVYEALRSVRVYKAAMSHDEALRIIVEGAGTQFDPAVTGAFARIEERFETIWASAQ
ncbi:MAG: HD domain-containing protein [Coriobacteriia bacterium]|nr:HD domain-containing protein [Coriobacteriia bacterium]